MFGTKRRHDRQDERDAEEFAHRLAEVRADLDGRPPTISDGREVDSHLRHVHIGAHLAPTTITKPSAQVRG